MYQNQILSISTSEGASHDHQDNTVSNCGAGASSEGGANAALSTTSEGGASDNATTCDNSSRATSSEGANVTGDNKRWHDNAPASETANTRSDDHTNRRPGAKHLRRPGGCGGGSRGRRSGRRGKGSDCGSKSNGNTTS